MILTKGRTLARELLSRVPLAYHALRDIRDTLRIEALAPSRTSSGYSLVGSKLVQLGLLEPEETRLLEGLLPLYDVFVDVGANIGHFTCLAKFCGCHVVAIEPARSNLQFLYKNLQLNNWDADVEVFPLAAGGAPTILKLYGSREGVSLIPGWSRGKRSLEQVPVIPLDVIAGSRFCGQSIFVKIDVEGFEYDVLKGAASLLHTTPSPLWMVEIYLDRGHPEGTNPRFEESFAFFFSAGYRCFAEGQVADEITPEAVSTWVQNGAGPQVRNFVFTQRPAELSTAARDDTEE